MKKADAKIQLNNSVSIDLPRLIESRLVILANSGAGKSWLIRRIAEHAVGKIQTIILDPEGEFSTLREKYDFLHAGKDADVPAEPKSAAMLALKLLELGTSAIVDLYELHPQERQRFVKLFCEAMVNCPKDLYHPVLVILDEAHDYVPEGKPSEATYAVEALASKGRKRGQCLVLASQRISKLSKNAAAECNNKLIGRASQDIDMKRAAEELGLAKDKMVALRQLKPGEFYAFGPAISDDVQKIQVGSVATTHAKIGYGAASTRQTHPSTAITKVLEKFKDLPKEAEKEAQTSKELREQLRVLSRQLREQKSPTPEILRVEVPVLKDAQITRLEKVFGRMVVEAERHGSAMSLLWGNFDEVGQSFLVALETISKAKKASPAPLLRVPSPPLVPRLAAEAAREIGEVSRPQQSILDALAWLAALGIHRANKVQLAFLADQSPRSSGYSNNLGALRSAGLIHYPVPNEAALTDAGNSAANAPATPATTTELHERVQAKLTRPQWSILKVLIDSYPADLSKDELAIASRQSATSSGYSNNLGSMRSLGLIDYPSPGRVKANSVLFID